MRLSQAVDRLFDALEDRLHPEDLPKIAFARAIMTGLCRAYGDIELNIEIKRVPLEEVVDVEGKEKG